MVAHVLNICESETRKLVTSGIKYALYETKNKVILKSYSLFEIYLKHLYIKNIRVKNSFVLIF